MKDWKFLGRYAITSYAGSRPCEYVVVGKNVVGFSEQNDDGTWSYYQFGQQEKGVSTPPAPILKATAKTAEASVNEGSL